MSPDARTRFLADAMLARLARWLRVLGYDTAFDPAVHDPELAALAVAEGRTLLTRDRGLLADHRPPRAVLIRSDAPLEQLREVVEACGVPVARPLFTRCLVCNTPLRGASPAEVESLVPERARGGGGPVSRCDGCGRVYWPGSHARRMRAALARAFPGEGGMDPSQAPEPDAPVEWYARREHAGWWRIPACREHGRALERHRFRPLGPRLEEPGRAARVAERCEVCRTPAVLGEVERCTCEEHPAHCPEHQNRGCGW